MGRAPLTRTARAHAVRAAALAWFALAVVLALTLSFPHGWFDRLLPLARPAALVGSAVLAAAAVAWFPLRHLGDSIVAELRAENAGVGRLRNVAEEISIAIGEPPEHVVVHESLIPNVGAFPTHRGVVVMATTQAVDQLRRDELEALVAAQFAGMRDPWCRLATRSELVWRYTIPLAFASFLLAFPIAVFVGFAMLFLPRSIEATRDLCADVAAVNATRHPAALAGGLRHLVPAAGAGREQKIVQKWYLPISPFLVLPKRTQSTTTVSVNGRTKRRYTDADEVRLELDLRADRAEALADGADPRHYTGREYRRRWMRLGATDED